jgi:predicted DNA-binding transcriptional regulator AlpA
MTSRSKECSVAVAAAAPPYIPDTLVPDPQVWREFGITSMTGWRWTHDPKLDFPQPVRIRSRCFRSRHQLEEFKARMMRDALRHHGASPSSPS